MTDFASTRKGTAAYKAAAVILAEGPMLTLELFARVHFGETADSRRMTLHRAMADRWLQMDTSGYLEVTPECRAFLNERAAEDAKPVGQIATGPTINMLTRPPLSRKYLTNSRGTRQDQPEWSKRPEGFTLRTVA